jgi:lysyl-tRNA synthetase class 1
MTEAIEAYLQDDLVKAIHVLVPQIENSLRHVLRLMGLPTNKPMRGPKGVMQEKNLNDILADPAIQGAMDENTINYLQTFLNDPRGQNVRNRVSHGLCQREFFGRLIADRVFHILLSISRLSRTGSESV